MLYPNAYIQQYLHKAGSDWCLMVALHDSLSSAPHCTGEGAYLCYMSPHTNTYYVCGYIKCTVLHMTLSLGSQTLCSGQSGGTLYAITIRYMSCRSHLHFHTHTHTHTHTITSTFPHTHACTHARTHAHTLGSILDHQQLLPRATASTELDKQETAYSYTRCRQTKGSS